MHRSCGRRLASAIREWARGRAHVESYGDLPVIVYEPEHGRHGNFFDGAYAAILERPEWARRFNKIHAQGRNLPSAESGLPLAGAGLVDEFGCPAYEFFCGSGVAEATRCGKICDRGRGGTGLGWKARVPLASGGFDRTEVDMRWGIPLVEAKTDRGGFPDAARPQWSRATGTSMRSLTGSCCRGWSCARREGVLPWSLPRSSPRSGEDAGDEDAARAFQAEIVERARQAEPAVPGYAGYQLIRNVLAAYAQGASFCVMYDARRPDLREAWFAVMAAVKSAEIRTRCKAMTWQESASPTAGGDG